MSKKRVVQVKMVNWCKIFVPTREVRFFCFYLTSQVVELFVLGTIFVEISSGWNKAKISPELARPLGKLQVNTAEFCKQFNTRTETDGWKKGIMVPVRIYTYSDRTYKFDIRYPQVRDILWTHKFKRDSKDPKYKGREAKPTGELKNF
ncbi:ribosomal protein L11 [Reticulomyxa filosa]|uniref:Ribosomal protein L11 n=1 Tax=Reticulomyxa filosa TaxID=46433 RepID=X6PGS3_RETFI|nr:ribosomal protein L11 [Reticulomyxa filosa]|eukprot:ETO36867.1 ribosomal protein L11 [Reticulomyxa filosa]